jgi:hypothetical protein
MRTTQYRMQVRCPHILKLGLGNGESKPGLKERKQVQNSRLESLSNLEKISLSLNS